MLHRLLDMIALAGTVEQSLPPDRTVRLTGLLRVPGPQTPLEIDLGGQRYSLWPEYRLGNAGGTTGAWIMADAV